MNVMVLGFDFAGCGLSDGEFVSLGFYEKDDLTAIVTHLRTKENVSRVGTLQHKCTLEHGLRLVEVCGGGVWVL